MKKILAFILLIAIIVVSVVGYTYISAASPKLSTDLKKCEIQGIKTQYLKQGFVYFQNPAPESGEYIYSPFALFKRDVETGGWFVKPEKNTENSLYNSTIKWINQGKYLDNTSILCTDLQTDEQLPPGFRQFIITHQIYFNNSENYVKELE